MIHHEPWWVNILGKYYTSTHILIPIFLQAALNSFSFIEILFLFSHKDFVLLPEAGIYSMDN